MRMKNELRAVAGAAVVALLVAGCGSNPVPPPVMAHGVEKGTVASAATAVGMQATAGHVFPPTVTFDRPYLMVVTDRATGEPLFMARVANPATR